MSAANRKSAAGRSAAAPKAAVRRAPRQSVVVSVELEPGTLDFLDRVASLANVTRDRVVNVLLALEVARQTRATGAAEPA